jgi:acyl-CoA hydrolase
MCFFLDLLFASIEEEPIGVITFGEGVPMAPKMISKMYGYDVDTVMVAMGLFKKQGLIEVVGKTNSAILIPVATEVVGSITDSALRMRLKKLRDERKKIEASNIDKKASKVDEELELEVRDKRLNQEEKQEKSNPTETTNLAHTAHLTINQPLLKTIQTDGDLYTYLGGFEGITDKEINTLKKVGREELVNTSRTVRDYFVAIAQKKLAGGHTNVKKIVEGTYCAIRDDEDIRGWLEV